MLDRAAQVTLAALNHLLQDAEWARVRLAPFVGRTARLTLPPWRLDFTIDADGQLAAANTAEPDVEISLPAGTPFLALSGREAVARVVRISGSAEFADALGFVLRKLRWDYEEDLSKAVGDIAAHRIAGMINVFSAWQRQAATNLAENFAEYFTEEQPTLAKPAAVADFVANVEALRDDLARLEKRVSRIPS